MKHYVISFLLIIGMLSVSSFTYAEELTTLTEQETVQNVPDNLKTPRETMRTFIEAMKAVAEGKKEAMNQAVSTLDLSDVNTLIRKSKGEEFAHTLSSVIERSKKVVLRSISQNPKNDKYVFGTYSQGKVEIVKQPDGRWLFSQKTVNALPAILEGLIQKPAKYGTTDPQVSLPFHIRFRAQLPDVLKGVFVLEYWQWLGILLAIVVGSIIDKLTAWFLAVNVKRWRKKHPDFRQCDESVLRPLGLMAMAVTWWFGLGLLGLPDTALIILSVAVKLLVSLSSIWSAFRMVDVLDILLLQKAMRTENKYDDLLVPMISKSLKVFIVVIGIILSADNFNVNVSSLLAGLGLGGLAFALAAKDLLGNFFGSLTVLLDRPFHIGDWVVIGDVEGSVEEVGFRSTRIRTFYNSLITLPNALLTTTKIDNMGARRYRRMKTMLSLTYDTSPEKIDAFCEGIRTIIQLHPYMRKDYYQVYFNEYSAASLDILVYVFWQTPDWNTELRERHRFLLDILRLAKQLDVEFAYPTQTIYLKQDNHESQPVQKFQPSMTQDEAFAMGQKEAEEIVTTTLGRGVKPGPVLYP